MRVEPELPPAGISPAPTDAARRPGTFPRTVVLLSLASFFNDVASELLLKGALPLYLVGVLGAPMAAVGLIDGSAEATAAVLQYGSGWWADHLGRRRPFVLAGYALSNLSKPLLYGVGAWWQVLVIRVVDRIGKGLRVSSRDALIAQATPLPDRGRAFGLNHALDPAGAMTSLLVGAALVAASQNPRAPLAQHTFHRLVLFIVLPGLSTLLLTGLVRETRQPARPPSAEWPFSLRGLSRPFRRFLLLSVLFSLGNSTDSFLIIRAWRLGLSLPHLFVALAAFNLMSVVFSLPVGALSDCFGRKRFLAAGWVLYAGVYLGFGYAREAWQVGCLLLLYGVYYGLTEGVSKALVADLVPAERRATAYGLLSAVQGIGVLPAGLLAGWLWAAVSPAAPFLCGGLLSLFAALGLRAVQPGRKWH